jgi:hypothetical protein
LIVALRPLLAVALAVVLGRSAQAVARGAATLPKQEKNNSADVQRSGVYKPGFICTEER